jgi:RsiW-degrading membrane proteinase PrsW (M82 family)
MSKDHFTKGAVPGRPDWANFRLLGNCLLWAVFFNGGDDTKYVCKYHTSLPKISPNFCNCLGKMPMDKLISLIFHGLFFWLFLVQNLYICVSRKMTRM